MSCTLALLITLNMFGGGQISIRADSIDAVEEYTCRKIVGHSFFSGYDIELVPCRKVTLKSGSSANVTESLETIKKAMEGKK